MLSNLEMEEVSGGGKTLSIVLIVGAAIAFIAGIIDGFQRPLKCNS